MRTLPAVALVLAACGSRTDPAGSVSREAPPTRVVSAPDQLALRIPPGGGLARVYAYPALDSAIWTSDGQVPAVARILALDAEAGALALVDGNGAARVLDFRLGTVSKRDTTQLNTLAAADAWSVFGIARDGSVARITPGARWDDQPLPPWKQKLPAPAQSLYPLTDGSLLVVGVRADTTLIWHLFPPTQTVGKATTIPGTASVVLIPPGDRLSIAAGSALLDVETGDLARLGNIALPFAPRAMEPTPSGDRLYVLSRDGGTLAVLDRFLGTVTGTIPLPRPVSVLRMDPLGRYLLARSQQGDSVWVISIATTRVVGAVRSLWRTDLPVVAPDGRIALGTGADVTFVDGETLRRRSSVRNAAKDFWFFFQWNGFRPRAAGLDQAVTFAGADSADSVANLSATSHIDSVSQPPPPPSRPPAVANSRPAGPTQYLVSFYALLDAKRAAADAKAIRVEGHTAHVSPITTGGVTVNRVVLGPYKTRAEADRIGQASHKPYWIYEEPPP